MLVLVSVAVLIDVVGGVGVGGFRVGVVFGVEAVALSFHVSLSSGSVSIS